LRRSASPSESELGLGSESEDIQGGGRGLRIGGTSLESRNGIGTESRELEQKFPSEDLYILALDVRGHGAGLYGRITGITGNTKEVLIMCKEFHNRVKRPRPNGVKSGLDIGSLGYFSTRSSIVEY
jgi:hypothetical protein